MPHFKRTISRFVHLPLGFRRRLPPPYKVTLPADTAVIRTEPNWLCKLVHPARKSALHLPTDTESEDEKTVDDGYDSEREDEKRVEGGYASESESQNEEDEDQNQNHYGDEDADTDEEDLDPPETFPYDLARKTRIEMMVQRLYVALSDDDREIAALRTLHHEKFTHIVRITFGPSSGDDKTLPSAWGCETNAPDSDRRTPFECRIRCPAFALGFGEYDTALTKEQVLLARKYIACSLPYRHDTWIEQGVKFPLTEEECKDTRVLIVGPAGRSVDVMTIFVCYLSLLSGACASGLLDSIKKLSLVHSHWKNYAFCNLADILTRQIEIS